MSNAQELQDKYEIRPDPVALTQNRDDPSQNTSSGVDYEPHPPGIKVSPEHQHVIDCITRLYSGSASEDDMKVYAEKAIYDDPWRSVLFTLYLLRLYEGRETLAARTES